MGLNVIFSGGDTDTPRPDTDPNPSLFKIISIKEKNNFTLAIINYPNCTNYEGLKILLYEGYVKNILKNTLKIDPHFLQNKFSPIARFSPNENGLNLVKNFMGDI